MIVIKSQKENKMKMLQLIAATATLSQTTAVEFLDVFPEDAYFAAKTDFFSQLAPDTTEGLDLPTWKTILKCVI